MSRNLRRLLGRLAEVGLEIDQASGVRIDRTRAGIHQRSVGAWSWSLVDAEGYPVALVRRGGVGGYRLLIGSQWSVRECVGARRLTWEHVDGAVHLYPEEA